MVSPNLMVTRVDHPRNRTSPCETVTRCVHYVLCVRHRLTILLEEYFEENETSRKEEDVRNESLDYLVCGILGPGVPTPYLGIKL